MTYKKTLLFTALCTLLSTSAYAAKENYSLPITAGEPASLSIELFMGEVTIEGYDGKTIEIQTNDIPAKTAKSASKMEKKLDKRLADKPRKHGNKSPGRSIDGLKTVQNQMMHLEIDQEDNEVDISSESTTRYVTLNIKVPFTTDVDVELYKGGDITINNISGSIEAESYQGAINASNISGPIVAETYNTDIVASFSDFSTVNPTSLTSHAGNIDITLSKSVAANIKVQSYQGEIYSGLDEAFVPTNDIKTKNKGRNKKITIGGMMQANVNKGQQDLSLVTYNGNVYIRKK